MPDDRPNILILMADQLKATALGLYGNRDVPTPNLERLAESGILYRRHYVAAPLCVPSRVAFWTGMYPHNTGVRHNQVLMPEDRAHYARLLSDAGYRMALIGKDHCFQGSDKDLFTTRMEAGHAGLASTSADSDARAVAEFLSDQSFNESVTHSATIPYPPEACTSSRIASKTAEYLKESADSPEAPFCAWISFPDPHHPLAAPEPFASMYSPESIDMPPQMAGDLEDKMERLRVYRHVMGLDRTSDEGLRQAVAMYYGMIRYLDDAIGAILDTLEETGAAEKYDRRIYGGPRRLRGRTRPDVEIRHVLRLHDTRAADRFVAPWTGKRSGPGRAGQQHRHHADSCILDRSRSRGTRVRKTVARRWRNRQGSSVRRTWGRRTASPPCRT